MRCIKKLMLLVCVTICLTACGQESNEKKVYVDKIYPLECKGVNLHLDCMRAEGVEVLDNILLVHGLTYSSHEFDVDYEDYSLVRYLCDNGYAVWRIDIAGYGQSDRVEDGYAVNSKYASENVMAAIDEIIKQTGATNIDLLGWSWGTVTSSLAEKEKAGVIDKFVLYAPILTGIGKADITTDYHKNDWENAASDFQMKEDGTFNYEITDPAVIDTYCSNCWKYDKEDSPCGGRVDLLVDKDVELINLAQITTPTLVICGDNDPYLNMPLVNGVLEKLPKDSKLVVIGGGAHCLMMEKPYYHKFQKEVLGFLKG